MKFSEIVAPSMKDLFIKTIENMILSGELKIGEKLPAEREMADQMKISRTIINLGLNELENKGFIVIVPRKGAYVADYIRNGKLETLISIINYNNGRFDKKTFYSLMEFRKINEGEGAYLAALNRTEYDIKLMETLYQKMLDEGSFEEISKTIFDFHHAVFCATGNYIFPLVHNAFENVSVVLTTTIFKFFKVEETTSQIKVIIDMIKAKDAIKAKEAMNNLINDGVTRLEENYFG